MTYQVPGKVPGEAKIVKRPGELPGEDLRDIPDYNLSMIIIDKNIIQFYDIISITINIYC